MTRINLGIGIRELCDQHLIAEYRELPRIWRMLTDAIARNTDPETGEPTGFIWIPGAFTLGEGHMAYFQDKGGFLHIRWMGLRAEMVCRGMIPNMEWRQWPASFRGHCLTQDIPNDRVMQGRLQLIRRINERLASMWAHQNNTYHPRWSQREIPAWVTIPEGVQV